ncbi:hypothetical protein [Hymenobacter sp.]|uniref:hypothetical protein n=1 Tax=Hymenobacter sp. TaxID=1898978 RepID=UPI00286AEF22|nr:hypothetical protein [Hymenobacter sp.]
MSILRYGFFGEDEAQRLFLHHYLQAIAVGHTQQFEANESFAKRFKGQNKTQVDDLFDEVCENRFAGVSAAMLFRGPRPGRF